MLFLKGITFPGILKAGRIIAEIMHDGQIGQQRNIKPRRIVPVHPAQRLQKIIRRLIVVYGQIDIHQAEVIVGHRHYPVIERFTSPMYHTVKHDAVAKPVHA